MGHELIGDCVIGVSSSFPESLPFSIWGILHLIHLGIKSVTKLRIENQEMPWVSNEKS